MPWLHNYSAVRHSLSLTAVVAALPIFFPLLGASLQTYERLPRRKLNLTSNAAGVRHCLWNADPGRSICSHPRNGEWPLADWLDHSHCRLLLQPDSGRRAVWNYPELYLLPFRGPSPAGATHRVLLFRLPGRRIRRRSSSRRGGGHADWSGVQASVGCRCVPGGQHSPTPFGPVGVPTSMMISVTNINSRVMTTTIGSDVAIPRACHTVSRISSDLRLQTYD